VVTPPKHPSKAPFEELLNKLNTSPETLHRKLQQEAEIRIAIETCESLFALTVAVNDMANRSIETLNKLTGAITAATEQAKTSSAETTNVARESANLSSKLNRLTRWIIGAAVLSAFAAAIQAGVAVFSILSR
jgi:hypothetical protein